MGGEMELLFRNSRQDASLHAGHRADESIDNDEERELSGVLAQAQADAPMDGRCTHAPAVTPPWPRLAAKITSISAGFGQGPPSRRR